MGVRDAAEGLACGWNAVWHCAKNRLDPTKDVRSGLQDNGRVRGRSRFRVDRQHYGSAASIGRGTLQVWHPVLRGKRRLRAPVPAGAGATRTATAGCPLGHQGMHGQRRVAKTTGSTGFAHAHYARWVLQTRGGVTVRPARHRLERLPDLPPSRSAVPKRRTPIFRHSERYIPKKLRCPTFWRPCAAVGPCARDMPRTAGRARIYARTALGGRTPASARRIPRSIHEPAYYVDWERPQSSCRQAFFQALTWVSQNLARAAFLQPRPDETIRRMDGMQRR